MRKPFDIKNGIEDTKRYVNKEDEIGFEETYGEDEKRLERAGEIKPKKIWLWLLVIAVVSIAAGRLYYLAVAQHDYYKTLADDNRLRVEYLPAPRGAIYDENGEVIAANKPSFELVAVPLDLPDDSEKLKILIEKVSEIVKINPEDIYSVINNEEVNSLQSVSIRQNLDRDSALIFSEQQQNLTGFKVVNTPIRDYHEPLAYSHLLGYVGKINAEEYNEKKADGYLFNDSIGKAGVEQVYENVLRGEFGQRQVEVDARGQVKKVYGEKDAVPGTDLYLNINKDLQDTLYQALQERLGLIGKKKAAVVAMNPKTGEILTYISLPGFNNNEFAEGISGDRYQRLLTDPDQPLFNRAIKGTYPPGSTVKPVVAMAALQEQVVRANTTINDQGYIVIENIYGGPDSFFYGFNRRALGEVDVKQAIAESSDVYFYVVGGGYSDYEIDGLGIEKLAEYYNQFKIGNTLGIDLPGERSGLVPTPDWKQQRFPDNPTAARWYLGNTYHAAIGQGDVLATPLNVLSWVSTIANNGKVMKPFIASHAVSQEGEEVLRVNAQQIGEIDVDQKYTDIVQQGMREAVTYGTARSLNTLQIPVAGKTGSAQFDPRNPERSHAWFAGYAPFGDPEIAIVVLVEDGGLGANVSVPIAKKGFEWWQENKWNK